VSLGQVLVQQAGLDEALAAEAAEDIFGLNFVNKPDVVSLKDKIKLGYI
jgi:hypothetical protein